MIRFNKQFVDDLEASNCFGNGSDMDAIREAWLDALPYGFGDEIDEDEFDTAAQEALGVACQVTA